MVPGDRVAVRLASPIEARIDDDAFRHERRAVALVECRVVPALHPVAEDRRVPLQLAGVAAGVGVQQELVWVEAVSLLRFVGPVHAITINLPGFDASNPAVEELVRVFR